MSAIVQANAGGSATGSGNTPFVLTSSAAGFTNPTVANNLLFCVVWFKFTSGNSQPINIPPPIVSTSGFAWSLLRLSSWASGNPGNWGLVWIFCIPNALAMNISATTVVQATIGSGGGGGPNTISSAAVEFALYEIDGLASPQVIDVSDIAMNSSGVPSTPATASLATSFTDMILVAMHSSGGGIAVGSGYTSGINASVAMNGQTQYQLGAPKGQVTTGFSGTENYWAVVAVAFKGCKGTPVVGSLYIPNWNNIAWTQPGGVGSQVFPAQNDGPMLAYPVPGQFISEAGQALWRAGCQHGFDEYQIFRDYDDCTGMSAAIQCCPICTYIVRIYEPYEIIFDPIQHYILV